MTLTLHGIWWDGEAQPGGSTYAGGRHENQGHKEDDGKPRPPGARLGWGQLNNPVAQIKDAIENVAAGLMAQNLTVTKAELELKLEAHIEGGVKISWAAWNFEHTTAGDTTHTLSIALIPQKGAREDVNPIKTELEQALKIIAGVVKQAAEIEPAFRLDEAKVALNIAISQEGKVSLILAGGEKSTTTSTVTLTIAGGAERSR